MPVEPSPTWPLSPPWRPAVRFLVLSAAALAAAWPLDAPAARHLATWHPSYSWDLFAMFRLVGYWPVWTLVAAAIALNDRGAPRPLRRAALLWTSVTVSGAASEALKLIIRRQRPDALGTYVFRAWGEQPFATAGLGMPSGHASIAFGAVWMLMFLYPRATPVWLLLGAGCAFTRIAGNDHFASDIVASCIVSYAVAWGTRGLFDR